MNILPPIRRANGREPAVGDRVIVRRHLPDTPGHLTDVIGHVVSSNPTHLVVRPQSVGGLPSTAPTITIDKTLIQTIKVLPPRRVRNSDIRAVEEATAKAFPGIEHTMFGGWLMRAGDGITERSNSAVPLGYEAGLSPVPLNEIASFYRRHDLPVRLLIPDRIGNPAEILTKDAHQWIHGPAIIVMTRTLHPDHKLSPLDISDPSTKHPWEKLASPITITVEDTPDDEWFSMYHFRGNPLPRHALELLRTRIDGTLGFGRIKNSDGHTIAITRATITQSQDGRRWLGFSAVEVAPSYRRTGLGKLLGVTVADWGAAHGATDSYLQVKHDNAAGIGLYQSLGFVEHHRHHCARLTHR